MLIALRWLYGDSRHDTPHTLAAITRAVDAAATATAAPQGRQARHSNGGTMVQGRCGARRRRVAHGRRYGEAGRLAARDMPILATSCRHTLPPPYAEWLKSAVS